MTIETAASFSTGAATIAHLDMTNLLASEAARRIAAWRADDY